MHDNPCVAKWNFFLSNVSRSGPCVYENIDQLPQAR